MCGCEGGKEVSAVSECNFVLLLVTGTGVHIQGCVDNEYLIRGLKYSS